METILGVPARRVKQLENDIKRGAPLTNLTQQERDVLHRAPSDENLQYWNAERIKAIEADDIPRIRTCDSARRYILLVIVPDAGDGVDDILGGALEQFEALPREH